MFKWKPICGKCACVVLFATQIPAGSQPATEAKGLQESWFVRGDAQSPQIQTFLRLRREATTVSMLALINVPHQQVKAAEVV